MRDGEEGIKARIVALDHDINRLIDRRTREATGADGETKTVRFEKAIDGAIAAHAELQDASRDLGPFSPTTPDRFELLPEAGRVGARDARAMIAAILAGPPAPAALAQPLTLVERPAPLPIEERRAYFTLQDCKYQHDSLKLSGRYTIAMLNEAQAATALGMEAVIEIDDPRVHTLRKNVATQQPPKECYCWNLDTGEKPTGIAIMDLPSKSPRYSLPANFAPNDRLSNPRLPAVASRKTPEDDK
jgi:hypothetical protein